MACLCAVPNFFPEANEKTPGGYGAQRHWSWGLAPKAARYLLLEARLQGYVKKDMLEFLAARRRAPRAARGRDRITGLAVRVRQCRSSYSRTLEFRRRPDQAARAVRSRLAAFSAPMASQPRCDLSEPAIGRHVDRSRQSPNGCVNRLISRSSIDRAPRQRTRHRRAARSSARAPIAFSARRRSAGPDPVGKPPRQTATSDGRHHAPPEQALQGRVPPDSKC